MHLAGVGGAFGGREDVSMQIHGAVLALQTNRPVKIVYSREESFTGHVHRHPSRIWAEHRATHDGKLVCVRMRILLDGGAYASSSGAVCSNAACFACGPYAVPNALLDATVVYTNNPPCGAMRGFGAVQTCFAAEAQMDKLAAALGVDPIELRLRNALAPGDTLPTGQRIDGSLPVAEVIRQAAALEPPQPEELPRDPLRLPGGAGNTTRGEGVRRGIGFAAGFKNLCFSEGFDDYCAARVRLFDDGSAEIHCAAAEVGQGVSNVILQVARTELGIDDVRLAPHSTATVDSAGSTSASRQTMMVSGAVRDACRAALAEREARGGGDVDVERVYRHPLTSPLDPETGQITGERAHVAFGACAMKVLAEVDVDLGLTRIVWIGVAQEIGKAIDPRAVEGQIEGGIAQGLGLALMEEISDPRRPDHKRELHRLSDPDDTRHAAGRDRADRRSRAERRVRREGGRRAAHGRRHRRSRRGTPRRDGPRASTGPRSPGRDRRAHLTPSSGAVAAGGSWRTTTATAATTIAAPTRICKVKCSFRNSTPSRIATIGFT